MMAYAAPTTNGTLLVAIDVAKRSHEVLVQWPDGKRKTFKLPSNHAEFVLFTGFLAEQRLQVKAALEPTADYHRTIAHWLLRHGVDVHLASSLACARVREALFNSWDKNDRKDAKVIMYLLSQGLTKPFHDPLLNGYMHLQELAGTYQQISLARTRCRHSLINHYLPLFFPEFERYLHSSRAEWIYRFLLQFPVPRSISSLSLDSFLEQAWELVGKKTAKQRFLTELYEMAHSSIALPIEADAMEIVPFRTQLERLQQLTEHRNALEGIAHGLLKDDQDYLRLRTIPGIGPIIGLIILAESGDLRRFAHHRQYLAFCGFSLSGSQSGGFQGRYRINKRGNARLRYAYWLAATVAIRQQENSFRQKYERYIANDRESADVKRKAYCAIAIKMARVAHSLVKQECDYRGYHEAGIPGSRTRSTGRGTHYGIS